MKTLLTAVLAYLFLSTVGMSAELVVTAKEDDDGFITYLHRLDKKGFKRRSPDNSDKEQMKGKLVWKDLEPGIYRLVIDPMEENFDSHWIGIQTIKVIEGLNKVALNVPKGHVVFSVSFDGIAVPKQHGYEKVVILRAERLLKDGSVDPLYRDWIGCLREKNSVQGSLLYLLPGRYRLTAFTIDEQSKMKDVGAGEIELTEGDFQSKAANVTITKIVEQAGTGQPATRSQSKSEGSDKPRPEAEGRSR